MAERPRIVEPVNVAYCPEHGLHGSRARCFACGEDCEQIPMVENRIGARDAITERVPPLDAISRQIGEDHAEGSESVTLTRATARALYYAIFDTLNVSAARDFEVHDVLRIERFMATLGGVGWADHASAETHDQPPTAASLGRCAE